MVKRLLTYLYRKYVLMPELEKMGFENIHFVEQIDNIEMFELDEDYPRSVWIHEGNRTIQ